MCESVTVAGAYSGRQESRARGAWVGQAVCKVWFLLHPAVDEHADEREGEIPCLPHIGRDLSLRRHVLLRHSTVMTVMTVTDSHDSTIDLL